MASTASSSGLARLAFMRRGSRLRRLGCWLALVLWFVLLVTPCGLLYLATQNELQISLGELPGQTLRVWLVNESRLRGIAISSPSLVGNNSDGEVCLQTQVSFVLWMGEGEGSRFCDCFARDGDRWALTSTSAGECALR
ncbi:MAG: hypothetical protein JNJ61_21605 [Anaerolineae bacterium]|nr:hypothetical protein [Anaerolineae bacterium]